MKKILLLGGLILLLVELQAHGACLVENLKKQEACTGGASGIDNSTNQNSLQFKDQTNYKELEKMYQIPTISTPTQMHNNFPMLNPTTNCMFGMCQP